VFGARFVGRRTLDVFQRPAVGECFAVEEIVAEQLVDGPHLVDLLGGVAENEVDVRADVGVGVVLVGDEDRVGHVIERDSVELLGGTQLPFEADTVGDVDAFDDDRNEVAALVLDGPNREIHDPRFVCSRLFDNRVPEPAAPGRLDDLFDILSGAVRLRPPRERPKRLAEECLDGAVDHLTSGLVGAGKCPVGIEDPRCRAGVLEDRIELSGPFLPGRYPPGSPNCLFDPVDEFGHLLARIGQWNVVADTCVDSLAGDGFASRSRADDDGQRRGFGAHRLQQVEAGLAVELVFGDEAIDGPGSESVDGIGCGPGALHCGRGPCRQRLGESIKPVTRADEQEGSRVEHRVRGTHTRSL